MQKVIFPILKTWKSQYINEGSYKDTKALDFGVLHPYKDTKQGEYYSDMGKSGGGRYTLSFGSY